MLNRFFVVDEAGELLFKVERLALPLPGDRLVIPDRGVFQVVPGRVIGLHRVGNVIGAPFRPKDAAVVVKRVQEGT